MGFHKDYEKFADSPCTVKEPQISKRSVAEKQYINKSKREKQGLEWRDEV